MRKQTGWLVGLVACMASAMVWPTAASAGFEDGEKLNKVCQKYSKKREGSMRLIAWATW